MSQLAVQDLQAHCAAARALLLDVREPWEIDLAALSLPGVAHKHIPLGHIPDRLDELDPSQSIVCICHHGVRSLQVVAFLKRQGFESVYNLAGGIDAWSAHVDPGVPRY
ncbi:rhodanese-like domain-containing protein [Piscinibacter sp.]|uniref:rhodanese-like domain-containing protein n=1 Tax=Piscinibacter sp. TaxID=1903157 RepID=UPI002CE64070|nr:rhodanese-like domain-containing protein [Albitalea sp.]HUG21968.1 rhodanese-like domain-containing protein [Albitalea sp.]